jgi:uncharacterized protein involved in exopolysaccharide biosynthesis
LPAASATYGIFMIDVKPIFFVFLSRIKRLWWLPLITVTLTTALAILYLSIRTPAYDVSMIVAPVTPPGSRSSGSLLGGGAASLLGLSQTNPSLDKYQQVLVSMKLADSIGPNSDIYHQYFSSEWDAKTGTWHPPKGVLASFRRSISEALGADHWRPPGAARFADEMQRGLVFSPVGKSDLLRITFRTQDPTLGIKLLTVLNAKSDAVLRDMERGRVDAYLGYLNKEIPNVQNSENRAALANLIQEQQRQMMSLNSTSVSYSIQLIEPPSRPYMPLGMRPLRLLLLAIVFGLLLGAAVTYYLPPKALS